MKIAVLNFEDKTVDHYFWDYENDSNAIEEYLYEIYGTLDNVAWMAYGGENNILWCNVLDNFQNLKLTKYQYNWDDYKDGAFYMNLTFRLKNEYRKKGTTTNDETIT